MIKVGTSTLTGDEAGPDRVYINALAAQIATERQAGRQVTLVTSGAIRAGMARLNLREKPRTIPGKQAAASVGQGALMSIYADIFANYGIPVGQVLLTQDDLRHRDRYVNARNTFEALFASGVLPIVNENDTVATDEIRVGDNDTLAALVTSLIEAQVLILLSDVAGLFDKNPSRYADATLIEQVSRIDDSIRAMAGGAGTVTGTGGMQTKLTAAEIATGSGAAMWIAQGRRKNVIADCLAGASGVGTYFAPAEKRPSARKRWLAWASGKPRGTIVVNVCARRALEEEGRSLLPVGMVTAQGNFAPGDLVAVADEAGETFARGLTRYSAEDALRLAGVPTHRLAEILGVPATPEELIHRDSLVLLSERPR
ncbi:MAG: glutamate 5-kinase [Armatimonadaceae bacterium]